MLFKLFALSVLFSSTLLSAADKSNGCGPGWFVTDRLSFSATTTRGTTNSYVTPFAMTSGTSGCSKHSIVDIGGSYEFIAQNIDQIRLESALGQGEYLTALSQNLGCAKDTNLGGHFKNSFDELFANNQSSEAIFLSARKVCPN